MRAFESESLLNRGWEEAHHQQHRGAAAIGPHPDVQAAFAEAARAEAAWAEAAWAEAGAAAMTRGGGPMMPPPGAPQQQQLIGGGPPFQHAHGPLPPPHMHMRHHPLHHPQMFPPGGGLPGCMPPAPQQALSSDSTAKNTAAQRAPDASPLSASEVRLLDEAHERAWQSLACDEQSLVGSGAAMAAARQPAAKPMAASEPYPSDPQELEAAYLDTMARGLADEQRQLRGEAASSSEAAWSESADSAAAAEAATRPFGSAFEEMEAVWKTLSVADREAAGKALAGNGEASLESVWQSLSGGDYHASWEEAWQGTAEPVDALDAYDDAHAPYRFHADNPHLGGSNLLERGTILFRQGELTEAVLVLEAAVQAEPEDTIAWQTLGQAHADADDDARAISCLRRAVAADPHNLDALLALGVSYTNELDQTRALKHLQLWLESHPDFTDISDGGVGSGLGPAAAAGLDSAWARSSAGAEYENPFLLQSRVTALFLRAVEKRPANADLHAVLGVLYNLSRSYPEAMASFEAALRLRPEDYSLWNKLGATQANAMSCAEAVPCYIKALELKPQYVRALSNLGISYGNMANYEAAAQCYLKALSLNREASHIWGYLNMTFTSMGAPELIGKASNANVEVFREDFDF